MSYEVGDIVQLKSGGPLMTVSCEKIIRGFTGYPHLRQCTWFDESGNLHKETFSIDSLVEVTKPWVQELEKDAARYRYLKKTIRGSYGKGDYGPQPKITWHFPSHYFTGRKDMTWERALDASIDEAMKGE